jgi:predicted DNA-binding helix-hairpin-helix protein
MTNADIRSYYIRPPLVTSWITPLGAYVLLPERLALQTMIQEALMVSDQVIERKKIIVEIQNGTINDGWDAAAASRLNYAGYETRIMSEVKKDYVQSLLIDMTREQRPDQADSLLTFLGLPHDSLVSMADPDSSVDYRLILGIDYQPCFDPTIYVP